MRRITGLALAVVFLVWGCGENSKNPFGLDLLQRKDTGSEKLLEIKGMTKEMTYHYQVNVGRSNKIMIGEFRGLRANLLLRFGDLSNIPHGATVEQVLLCIWRYDDVIKTSDATPFQADIHKITQAWDDSSITTWEEIQNGYEPSSLQSIQITPEETNVDSFYMPTDLIQAWVDSTENNYGILLRSAGANFIKLYYSKDSAYSPRLKVYYSTNTGTDSAEVVATEDTYLIENTGSTPENRLIVGAGYGFATLLHFDVNTDSLPKGTTVNRALLTLMVDTTQTILRKKLTFVLSSIAVKTEPEAWSPPDISLDSTSTSISSYSEPATATIDITHLVQNWVSQRSPNHGLRLGAFSDQTELVRLSFYASTADSTLIPKVEIFYATPPIK